MRRIVHLVRANDSDNWRQEMITTQELISGMVKQYCNLFLLAINEGRTEEQAHIYCKNYFDAGFKYLAEKAVA